MRTNAGCERDDIGAVRVAVKRSSLFTPASGSTRIARLAARCGCPFLRHLMLHNRLSMAPLDGCAVTAFGCWQPAWRGALLLKTDACLFFTNACYYVILHTGCVICSLTFRVPRYFAFHRAHVLLRLRCGTWFGSGVCSRFASPLDGWDGLHLVCHRLLPCALRRLPSLPPFTKPLRALAPPPHLSACAARQRIQATCNARGA